jgi:hypothetical protein
MKVIVSTASGKKVRKGKRISFELSYFFPPNWSIVQRAERLTNRHCARLVGLPAAPINGN